MKERAARPHGDTGPSGVAALEAPPPRRRRVAESTVRIDADRAGLFAFEAFIDNLRFILPSEHARLKLTGGEILDNLIRHSAPLAEGCALVRVARRHSGLYLSFFFRSPSFAAYSKRLQDHEPIFDHRARRWHGMGLRMCRNLSASLIFRAGSIRDRVIIKF